MIKRIPALMIIIFIAALLTPGCLDAQDSSFKNNFGLSERTLVPTGRNDFFILEPGFQMTLEGSAGFLGMTHEKLIITVLDETRKVDSVLTRVVEEREWKNDELYEVARNFFAIDEETGDVFYFGEEVDFYTDGKIIGHKGAWLAGEDGATAGLIMAGKPEVGMKYYQEFAPNKAMDRAEVINLDEVLETPAGEFTECLKIKEGTALNRFEREFKTYAPGIGLIQDQSLLLVDYGFVGRD
jgi:hypothetical protein